MTTPCTFTTTDAKTNVGVPDVILYLNGVGQGTTDANGILTLEIGSEISYISISAPNYSSSITTIAAGQVPSFLTIFLQPSGPTTVTMNLTVIPEDKADGNPITISGSSSPIVIPYQIGSIQVPGLSLGDQTIIANISGYNPVSQLITLTPTNLSQTINLVANTDTGMAVKQQTLVTPDPDTSTILPTLTPENIPEFVAPNTGQGTYFTMTQARMYIGTMFIDELNGLQFALQDNKIPVYGYASRYYDAISQGKSLVQGQFTINFISEGYLVTVLREYVAKINTPDVSTVTQQQQARLLTLTNQLSNPNGSDPGWTPTMIQSAKKEIGKLAASLGPAALDNASGGISANVRLQSDSILGLPGGDYPNAIYEDTAFDIVINYSGAGRVITRRLEDCHLISNESIMDHSGTPILDSYGFISRRLR